MKAILALLLQWENTEEPHVLNTEESKYIWERVIVRWYYSWVHFWKLESRKWTEVILAKSRRLRRRWTKGIDLTALAQEWLHWYNLKICWEIESIEIIDNTLCEIIPCSQKAIDSIRGYSVFIP